jgi:hypothetical protein
MKDKPEVENLITLSLFRCTTLSCSMHMLLSNVSWWMGGGGGGGGVGCVLSGLILVFWYRHTRAPAPCFIPTIYLREQLNSVEQNGIRSTHAILFLASRHPAGQIKLRATKKEC